MRRVALIALLVVVGLVVIGGIATWAQVIDGSPCEHACYEQKSLCISECGEHPNPVECEAVCHDALPDCLKECR